MPSPSQLNHWGPSHQGTITSPGIMPPPQFGKAAAHATIFVNFPMILLLQSGENACLISESPFKEKGHHTRSNGESESMPAQTVHNALTIVQYHVFSSISPEPIYIRQRKATTAPEAPCYPSGNQLIAKTRCLVVVVWVTRIFGCQRFPLRHSRPGMPTSLTFADLPDFTDLGR